LDQDFVVPSNEKTYTLKADFNKIGQNEPGILDLETTFALKSIEAEGVSSGATLTAADTDGSVEAGEIAYETDTYTGVTAVSKYTGVVASKMAPISLVSSYGGKTLSTKITTGITANAAIIAVTVPSTLNKNDDGTALKTYIDAIYTNMETDGGVSWDAYIERIGGTSGTWSANENTDSGSDYMSFYGWNNTYSDFLVTPGETAYFLVTVVPYFTASYSGEYSLKVGLDHLDNYNTTFEWNFEWYDRLDASKKYEVRMPGITSITGVSISN
jgi:hypothetical protein